MATANVHPLLVTVLEKLSDWMIAKAGDSSRRAWAVSRVMKHAGTGPYYLLSFQMARLSAEELAELKAGHQDVVALGVDNSQDRLAVSTSTVAAINRAESLPGDGTDADTE